MPSKSRIISIVIGCLLTAAALSARGDSKWTTITTDKGSSGYRPKHKTIEFKLDEEAQVRFTCLVTVNPPEDNKHQPYFRLKLEMLKDRNRYDTWQNVAVLFTTHRNEKGQDTRLLSAGRYRMIVYYRDVRYETKVERSP